MFLVKPDQLHKSSHSDPTASDTSFQTMPSGVTMGVLCIRHWMRLKGTEVFSVTSGPSKY